MLRVLLVDDHAVFRQSLSTVIALQGDLEVVGEASDARSAAAGVDAKHPDVVVLDVTLPGLSGMVVARDLRRRAKPPQVMMLTMHASADTAAAAFAAGALGYACKDSPLDEVLRGIRAVGAGQRYLAPSIDEADVRDSGGPHSSIADLSDREVEVFDLAVAGHTNRAIAGILCISVKTVESHRAAINRKLGVHSTASLVRFAASAGLLQVKPPPKPTA